MLLFTEKPVAVVVIFTIVGAFFIPFLSALLLYLSNRRDWVGSMRNGVVMNAALVFSLVLFGWIAANELLDFFQSDVAAKTEDMR